MKYLIIAFKSRNDLQSFARTIRLYGINVSIVNTPRSVSVSCGLSARAEYRYLNTIKTALTQTDLTSFIGIYAVTRNGVYEQVEKIF